MTRFVLCLSFVTSALWPSQVHGQGTQFSYNGLANTPQMGWVSQSMLGETKYLLPGRITGMLSVAMSAKSSYWEQHRRLSIMAFAILDTTM